MGINIFLIFEPFNQINKHTVKIYNHRTHTQVITLSLCKTPLGETGCLSNPYFYLLVA